MAYEDTLMCRCGHEARHHAEQPGDDHCLDCVTDQAEQPCAAFEYDEYQDERAWRRAYEEARHG